MVHIPLVLEKTLGIGFILCFDTLLHELSHNEVGPHNEHFWHLFTQLKVAAGSHFQGE